MNRLGTRLVTLTNGNDLVRFFVSTSLRFENLISGQIFVDTNNNCIKEANELPLPGIVVATAPGNYYGISDENGAYVIAADTGRYLVQQLLPTDEVGRTMQLVCAANTGVVLRNRGDNVGGVNFGNEVSTAPHLSVSVASDGRRRCFRNTTAVSYANTGFAPPPMLRLRLRCPRKLFSCGPMCPIPWMRRATTFLRWGCCSPTSVAPSPSWTRCGAMTRLFAGLPCAPAPGSVPPTATSHR